MAVSHPGSTERRSLVEAEHNNVIFNYLGTKKCCVLFSYLSKTEKQTHLKELCSEEHGIIIDTEIIEERWL